MAAWKHAAVFYVAFLGLLGTASASARRDILQNGQCGAKGQACCCDVSGVATLLSPCICQKEVLVVQT
jgi:hypothetical protein